MAEEQALFTAYLNQYDDAGWAQVSNELLSSIHPVDQRATQIWFAFFPLKLKRALDAADDPDSLARSLILKGRWRLADQVDEAAHFLYGHRYWPEVKRAVADYAESATAPQSLALADQILQVAGQVAAQVRADKSLLVGITAVAFMTLQQVGAEVFRQPAIATARKTVKSPEQIVRERQTDDSQGLFSFLRSVNKKFTVTFDESDPTAKFPATEMQDLAMAAAADKRPHHLRDERCKEGEGAIPVECRTAACGTCWVGVLSDPAKVSVPAGREVNRMNDLFCYPGFNGEQTSPIRLACQTVCHGNVSIVIPPWNGVLWKLDRKSETEATEAAEVESE